MSKSTDGNSPAARETESGVQRMAYAYGRVIVKDLPAALLAAARQGMGALRSA